MQERPESPVLELDIPVLRNVTCVIMTDARYVSARAAVNIGGVSRKANNCLL